MFKNFDKEAREPLATTLAFKTNPLDLRTPGKMKKGSDYKGPGGKLIRIRLGEEQDRIRSKRITGDFFLVPEESLGKLETLLVDAPLRETELRILVNRFFKATGAQAIGASTDDFVNAILSVREEP